MCGVCGVCGVCAVRRDGRGGEASAALLEVFWGKFRIRIWKSKIPKAYHAPTMPLPRPYHGPTAPLPCPHHHHHHRRSQLSRSCGRKNHYKKSLIWGMARERGEIPSWFDIFSTRRRERFRQSGQACRAKEIQKGPMALERRQKIKRTVRFFLARDATGARKNRTLFGVQLGNSSEISTSRGRVPRRLPGYRCGFAAGLDKSNASSSASNPDLVADSQRGRGNSSLTHTDSGGSATPIRPLTGFRAARLFGFFWRALQG